MYQIAINDPKIYQAGEIFARENHSTLDELVNKYVAELAAKILSRKESKQNITQTEEFKQAMKYMDTFVAEDLCSSVPVDEDGNGALARIKYGL